MINLSKDYPKRLLVHNFLLNIFFITSIVWGIGYPELFRLPFYLFFSILIILTSKNLKNIKLKFNKFQKTDLKQHFKLKNLSILIVPLFFYLFTWNIYSIFYSLCVLFYSYLIINFSRSINFLNKNHIYNLSIISIFIVLISVPFRGPFNEFVLASPGLFPEPSHLGFTVGPLLGILSRNKKYQPLGFLGILFFHFFCFSRSLWLGYLFSIVIGRKFKTNFKSVYLSLFILGLIFLVSFSLYFFAERITNIYDNQIDLSKYASTLIWYYWLKQSLINLIHHPLGIGPFAWLGNETFLPEAVIKNSEFIPYLDVCDYKSFCKFDGNLITGLNIRDLSSLLTFGLISFGALFPIYLFFLLRNLCSFKIQISKEFYILHPLSVLCISYVFVYMFRWTGLIAGPFLGVFCLLGSVKLLDNKKHKKIFND